jgi:MYXO-CTERM domain-containing protein
MSRRWWLLGLLPVLVAPGTWGAMRVEAYLNAPIGDEVVVRFETTDPRLPTVEWGLAANNLDRKVESTVASGSHELVLTGLPAGQTVFYKVTAKNSAGVPTYTSPVGSFKTAPLPGSSFKLAILSDTLTEYGSDRAVSQDDFATILDAWDPDLLLHAGNHVEDGAKFRDWEQYFRELAALRLAAPSFDVWGPSDRAGGNTGGESNELATLLHAMPGNERYWSAAYGQVLFIGLDVHMPYDGRSEAALAWLDGVLAEADDGVRDPAYIVVLLPQPGYGATSVGGSCSGDASTTWVRDNLAPRFEAHGVSLVVSGGERAYVRAVRNGVTWLSVVTSDRMRDVNCAVPEVQASRRQPSISKVSVTCDNLSLTGHRLDGSDALGRWVTTGDTAFDTVAIPRREGTQCSYDVDADGVIAELDCDDDDPAVKPGAAERCGNGKDDDCDGLVDGADPDCAGVDTDVEDTGDTDPGDTDSGDASDTDTGDPYVAQLGCSCATGAGSGAGLGLALAGAALALVRRRRSGPAAPPC